MKKPVIVLLLYLASLWLATACGSGDSGYTCKLCTSEPEALPADDGRASGIYKGIIAGTTADSKETLTGTLKAVVATDMSTATCELVINESLLTADAIGIEQSGGKVDYTFSSDEFELSLAVSDAGEILESDLVYGDAYVETSVGKEESDALLKCFEGTWRSEDDSWYGVWNFIYKADRLEGNAVDDEGFVSIDFEGDVNGKLAAIRSGSDPELAQGRFDGEAITGTWDTSGLTGTWEGRRTL